MKDVKDILEKYTCCDDHNDISGAEAELNQHYLKVFMDLIDQPHNIYLTKDQVAKGDYGDDVARHWDSLRAKQRQQAKLKLLGEESDE